LLFSASIPMSTRHWYRYEIWGRHGNFQWDMAKVDAKLRGAGQGGSCAEEETLLGGKGKESVEEETL
ncbi:Hypothetical predicted protein, partial [Olea europaea subsp. europaea]